MAKGIRAQVFRRTSAGEGEGMPRKTPKRLGITITLALVTAALATASPASAAVVHTGGCGTDAQVNVTSNSCSFTLNCVDGCSFSGRLHVSGVGLVGGSLTATPISHCRTSFPGGEGVDVPCDPRFPPPPASTTDSCTHLLSCEAAVGGVASNRSNFVFSQAFTRVIDSIRMTCTETGPAVLEHVACTGETVIG